jgi:hypothetical protein
VLEQPQACNITFEVKESENSGVNNWDNSFKELKHDLAVSS